MRLKGKKGPLNGGNDGVDDDACTFETKARKPTQGLGKACEVAGVSLSRRERRREGHGNDGQRAHGRGSLRVNEWK